MIPKLKTLQKSYKFNLYKSKIKEVCNLIEENVELIEGLRKQFVTNWNKLDNKEFKKTYKNELQSKIKEFALNFEQECDQELKSSILHEQDVQKEEEKDEENENASQNSISEEDEDED